jgi:hypothetical protein
MTVNIQREAILFVPEGCGLVVITPANHMFVVEWLTLLLHILEVPGSNCSPETSYAE